MWINVVIVLCSIGRLNAFKSLKELILFRFNFWIQIDQGKIKKLSQYCPVDLFSGYCNRMKKAIRGLIEEPQNNFRLCKNGLLIFDDKTEPVAIDSIVADVFKERPSAGLYDVQNFALN